MARIDTNRIFRIWKTITASDQPTSSAEREEGRPPHICDEWREFERFAGWAIVSGYTDRRDLVRANSTLPYSPQNCSWVRPSSRRFVAVEAGEVSVHGKLTAESVEIARSSMVDARWNDGGGLYLQVRRSGEATWYFDYTFGGAQRRIRIGDYPDVALIDARRFRDLAARQLASGVNIDWMRNSAE